MRSLTIKLEKGYIKITFLRNRIIGIVLLAESKQWRTIMKNYKLVGLAALSLFLQGTAFADHSEIAEVMIGIPTHSYHMGKQQAVAFEEDSLEADLENSMLGIGVNSELLKDTAAKPLARVSSIDQLEEVTGEAKRKAEQLNELQKPSLQHKVVTFIYDVGNFIASAAKSVWSTFKSCFGR